MKAKDRIIEDCYKNYLRTSKNHNSDTWQITSAQNIEFFKTVAGDNVLINSNIRGLAPIDNYPNTSYLKNNKDVILLNKFHKKLNFFELYKKNKFGNYYFSSSFLIQFNYFLKIKKYLNRNSKILIIGDGLGILSSFILLHFNCKVFLCDLPETLIYQEYYLKKNFKNLKTNYVANILDNIDLSSQVNFVNADLIHEFNIDLDMVVNTDSMSEMDKFTIDRYYKFIDKNLKVGGYYYNNNPIALSGKGYGSPGYFPLGEKFKIKDIEVLYPSHRDTFCKYLSVLAQKVKLKNKIKNKQHWLKLRKYYLDYFYTNSEKIINSEILNKIKNKTLKICNLIITNKNLKTTKKQYNLKKLYMHKNNFKKKINLNNFYHRFMKLFLKSYGLNRSDAIDQYLNYFLKIKKSNIEISDAIKLLTLSRFFNINTFKKIIDKIPEDSFEKMYLKFAEYENLEQKKRNEILLKLQKLKSNQYFDELKFLYCCYKLNDVSKIKSQLIKIKSKINTKLFAINFLKLLLVSGKFKNFNKHYYHLAKKFKIKNSEKVDILLSTCFVEEKTIKNFKINFKNQKFENSNSLAELVLKFKLAKISEKRLMKIIFKRFLDYYSIGFVLKIQLSN